MPLPTLVKTWQMSLNNAAGNQGSQQLDARNLFRALKNQLLAFGSNPWTTHYSNNGTTAGTAGDGVDRWTADSSLVWATTIGSTAASWYVFKNTNIGSNFQMMWFCSPQANQGNNERFLGMWVSPSAGFTGGTTTTRPTATDEIQFMFNSGTSNVNAWFPNNVTAAFRWHMWHSSDGQVTRWVVHYQNWVLLRGEVGLVANATSGWTAPAFYVMAPVWNSGTTPVNSHVNSFTNLFNGGWGRSKVNAVFPTFNLTTEAVSNVPLGSVQTFLNDIDFTYKLAELGVWTSDKIPGRGHHGMLYDAWSGLAGQPEATTFPANGRRQFVQFGAEVFPWDGTPSVTGSLPLTG